MKRTYCSKECQLLDWKNHKCDLMKITDIETSVL